MSQQRPHFFSLHELLVMAALAALGGVSSSATSMLRVAVHALVAVPGGLQYMAGIHILWLVLAVGLVRKPGAATVTGLLKGAVELLSGNPHGLLVLMYAGLAGVAVDAVWLLLGCRQRLVPYMLAGGAGAASNVLVLAFVTSMPAYRGVIAGVALLAAVAFVSGVVLAGLLGWWLLRALRLAGVVGAEPPQPSTGQRRRAWAGIGALCVTLAAAYAATCLAHARAPFEIGGDSNTAQTTSGDAKTPQ
jgi:energy-coupling factor transport system substrate-specific component